MANEIATLNNHSLVFEPANLTKETVKRYICPMATDQELTFFLQVCKTFGLNPLKREVYLVKYGEEKASILVGYEVYLKRAERSSKWGGMEVGTEGSIKEGNLKAVVKIYRKDWAQPLIHEADYNEYVQTKKDGTPNRFWATKPKTMIKKVAISQAFRFAFPDEFDGMPYTSDEVVDQEKIVDITSVAEDDATMQRKIKTMQQTILGITISIDEKTCNEVLRQNGVTDINQVEDMSLLEKVYKDLKKKLKPVSQDQPIPVGY